MKARIESVPKNENFKPYSVCFLITSKEESVRFHDKVAVNVAKPGNFIGQIYRRGHGEYFQDSEFNI